MLCVALGSIAWLKVRLDRNKALQRRFSYLKSAVIKEGMGARRFEAPAQKESGPPPNVLVIAVDNARADRMSCYGGPRPTTPNLDALANRGTRFARCVAQAPYTPHSFSSMLSSLYVADLEVRVREKEKNVRRAGLEPYNVTLAEAMHDAGYETAGIFIVGWFTEAFGLLQGFEHVSYTKPRWIPHVVDDTLEWIRDWDERGRERPFFLFSYSADLHSEFMNPKKYGPDQHVFGARHGGFNFSKEVVRKFRDGELVPSEEELHNALTLYDEGLYWTDLEIQRLLDGLDAMGLTRDTIVAFVSDHGEEFNEHGFLSHGQSSFGAVTDVPLIIVDPRREGGHVIEQRVMNIDVMPTILDLCGIPVPETAKGISLAPSVRGASQPELDGRYIFSEGAWNGFIGAVWAGPYKYLMDQNGVAHLFDLEKDPNEIRNLAGEMPELTAQLEQILFLHKREGLATQILLKLDMPLKLDVIGLPRPQPFWAEKLAADEGEPAPVLSEDSIKELKTLGYLE